jgi:REP element-mobilizing transposase RayT
MPRKPRLQAPGLHHVTTRGNNKQILFDDVLRPVFLDRLCIIATAYRWRVIAWALMTNHFHLVLEVGELGLAAGMQRLNLFLACLSNRQFGRVNHSLGRPYWNEPLEEEGHLEAALRYVLLNPVRATVVEHPADSTWTSYRASAGLERPHPALALEALLAFFGTTPLAAHAAFAAFIGGCEPAT